MGDKDKQLLVVKSTIWLVLLDNLDCSSLGLSRELQKSVVSSKSSLGDASSLEPSLLTFALMNRESLQASDFSYDLPDERIAKYPLQDRNSSNLLLYKQGLISKDVFSNLAQNLPANSLLVFNDTKVLSARLRFQKDTGAKIEVFCLEPYESTVEQALGATQSCQWQCMIGNLKRFKPSDILQMQIAGSLLNCRFVKREDQYVVVEFEWEGGIEFSNIMDQAGQIPLPPYLNREVEEADEETYQTVYAKTEGAVAAPTAGLHFIPNQLEELKAAGHQLAYLTLYVGAGTFRQVKADKLLDHDMHSERIVADQMVLRQIAEHDGPIIPVGTTSLRSLESLYWLAAKCQQESASKNLESGKGNLHSNYAGVLALQQNDAYELNGNLTRRQAFEFLQECNPASSLKLPSSNSIDFNSSLFIMPGYTYKVIDGLITNFHQPQSTLLSLVAALIGEDWKNVYAYAMEHDFRFLSYGDSSLLLP